MTQPPEPITADAKAAVEALLDLKAGETEMDETYEITPEVASAPLVNASVPDLVAKALSLIAAEHFVFPDAASLVEQAVVALLGGHLLLHGPPGTGKTRLAEILASAFDAELHTETGTPDWSTYDVVGGLRPGRDANKSEVLRPWLGHIPRAALRCAELVKASLDTGGVPQAHWLNIDELSRADIDKAIGPLYTALSGRVASERQINLWFEDHPNRLRITLPERFRLIGTLNDVDTAFVTQLSQGLQRRFEWLHLGVPHKDQTSAEVEQVTRQAAKWYGRLYGGVSRSDLDEYAQVFVDESRVADARARVGALASFLRWEPAPKGPRWPLGSAQLADVMRQVAVRAFGDTGQADLSDALDLAIANRLVPQTSALTGDQLASIESGLSEQQLPRSVAAVKQVREPHLTHPPDE